MSSQPITKPY